MKLRVRILRADQLGQAEIDAWRDLEDRAIEPNAFLSPYFALPALRHLDPDKTGLCTLVEVDDAGKPPLHPQIVGAAVFVHSGPTLRFPLPHLVGYTSEHSFLGGVLLNATVAEAALEALLDALGTDAHSCHGVTFPRMRVDGPIGEVLRRSGARGRASVVLDREQRIVMIPKETSQTYLAQQAASRCKSFRRRQRRLADLGPVRWTVHRSPESVGTRIEHHLDLEHRGWKGRQGTSLRSTASGAAFFREVFEAFGLEGRALFTELSVGDSVVASTSNLVSGRAAFAFKIGWEPSLARQAPGILSEIQLIRESPSVCPDIDWFDSGASPGSYLEDLWLERCEVAEVVVPLTRWARIALSIVAGLRWVRRRAAAIWGRKSDSRTPPGPTRDARVACVNGDAFEPRGKRRRLRPSSGPTPSSGTSQEPAPTTPRRAALKRRWADLGRRV